MEAYSLKMMGEGETLSGRDYTRVSVVLIEMYT